MKTILKNRWLIFTLRLILGVIFVAASISKIQDISKFISTVTSYGILPHVLADIYGYVAPWLELIVGFALILGVFIRISAGLSILLTLSFMVASSYALVNTVEGSCGCFGTFLPLSHTASLAIDVFMLLASFILVFNKEKEFFSIGKLTERFPGKSKVLFTVYKFASVVLLVIIIGLISLNLKSPPAEIVETVAIPTSLSNDVDNSLAKNRPVLMEFYAVDCHACEEAEPIINDLEKQYAGKVTFIRVDYYQNSPAVSDMNVMMTPTVFVIIGKNTEGKYNVSCRFDGIIEPVSLETCLEKAVESQ